MYCSIQTAEGGCDFYGIILDGLFIVIVGNARSTVGFRRLIICQHFFNNIKFGTLGGHTIPQYHSLSTRTVVFIPLQHAPYTLVRYRLEKKT